MDMKDIVNDLVDSALNQLITEEYDMGDGHFENEGNSVSVTPREVELSIEYKKFYIITLSFNMEDGANYVEYANELAKEVGGYASELDDAAALLVQALIEVTPDADPSELEALVQNAFSDPTGIQKVKDFCGLTQEQIENIIQEVYDSIDD